MEFNHAPISHAFGSDGKTSPVHLLENSHDADSPASPVNAFLNGCCHLWCYCAEISDRVNYEFATVSVFSVRIFTARQLGSSIHSRGFKCLSNLSSRENEYPSVR